MVEVVYRGAGMDGVTSNAASEATLLKLLQNFSKGGGDSGKLQKLHDAATTADTKATKKGTKATEEDTSKTKEHSLAVRAAAGVIKELAAGISSLGSMLWNAIGNVVEKIADMGMELVAGGTRLSDFSSHLSGLAKTIPLVGGLLGGALDMLMGIVDKNIDVFRSMADSGITLGTSMFDVYSSAAKAGMNIDLYSGLLTEHSQKLTLAFGSAAGGAKMYTEVLKEIKPLAKDFTALGITLEEYGDMTADFIELQRIQGRLDRMDSRDLAKGTANYIQELDRLAKVTGMTRKQAAEALQAGTSDPRMQAFYSTLDEESALRIKSTLAQLNAANKDIGSAVTDIIATGGVPVTDFGKSLMMITNGEVADWAAALKSGKMTQDEFNAKINGAAEKADEYVKKNAHLIGTMGALNDPILQAALELQKLKGYGEGANQALWEQQEALRKRKETNEAALLDFERAIENVRSQIMNKLVDTGVFEKLGDAIGYLTDWIEGSGFDLALIDMGIWLDTLIEDFKTLSISEMLDKYLWQPLKTAIFGGGPEKTEADLAKSRDARLAAVQAEWDALSANEQDSAANIQKFSEMRNQIEADFQTSVAEVQAAAKNDGESNKGLLGEMFSGILDYLPSMETLGWGLGLVTAAVIAMGVAGVAASPGLLLIGAAFLSIGAAGAGVGYMVEKIAEAVTSLREDIELFSDMNTEKLSEVGNAMTPLTDSILTLAKAGFVANFINDGSFKKLADGIKEFEGIKANEIANIGPAMVALQKGMAAFTGDGVMESVGKVFSSWISGKGDSGGQMKEMADNLKVFGDIDANGLVAVGGAMEGIANFIEVMDDTNIKNVAEAVDELTAAMVRYSEQGNKLTADMQGSFTTAVTAIGGASKGSSEQLVMVNNTLTQLLDATVSGNRTRVATKEAVEDNVG